MDYNQYTMHDMKVIIWYNGGHSNYRLHVYTHSSLHLYDFRCCNDVVYICTSLL